MEKPEFKGKVDILITETEFVTIQRLRKRLKNLIVAVQIAPEIHPFKAKNVSLSLDEREHSSECYTCK